MSSRPAIPKAIREELLYECRHRCACCCEPVALEKAHIDPWCVTKDHSAPNLIVLCSNCHTRADSEKWPQSILRKYKQNPCALASHAPPVMSPEQKAMVDLILAVPPEFMTGKERLRLASMIAAYAGVSYSDVRVVDVVAANSSRVSVELPKSAAERLIAGYQNRDPRLYDFLAEVGGEAGLIRIELASPEHLVTATKTDMSEKGLETLIFSNMVGLGWIAGDPKDYDREYAVDLAQLRTFLRATQRDLADALDLERDSPTRRKFLARLQGEITKRGTIDALRNGLKHGAHQLDLFYGTPSPGNKSAADRYEKNRFSITRQLKYSRDNTQLALDLCIFINGLPIATWELKNSITKQTVEDAIEQYKRDRDPRELLFQFGRCIAHFAVDDHEVRFCTQLKGKASWFLPFNQGWNDGAGNPPNLNGLKTDYLWKQFLTPIGLTGILENYAQIVEKKNEKTGKKKREQIFPRYHQLDVVRKLLASASNLGAGKRYLIQHSAGSGKSNSIAWLSHQLIGLQKDDRSVFDSIIVVTDRRILDQQIRNTIKQFAQVGATIGAVTEGSQQLRQFIESGKKIIISTVQKFPFILDEIGTEHRTRRFAIIIDEAHSSQAGAGRRRSVSRHLKRARRKRKRRRRTRLTGSWRRRSCFRTPVTSLSPRHQRTRP